MADQKYEGGSSSQSVNDCHGVIDLTQKEVVQSERPDVFGELEACGIGFEKHSYQSSDSKLLRQIVLSWQYFDPVPSDSIRDVSSHRQGLHRMTGLHLNR